MNDHYYAFRKPILVLIGLLLAGMFFGCNKDSVDPIDPTDPGQTQPVFSFEGTLPGGALYEIELPETWNFIPDGQRIILFYAHGYVDPGKPLVLPSDAIMDGMGGTVAIKDIILEEDIAYASTSYRDNGLVVVDAIEDIKELKTAVEGFFSDPKNLVSAPNAFVLVGPSEGGLITVLTIEQNQELFDGAVATCCPIGNFYEQLQYYGDAHVLFKYFFGSSINGIDLGSPEGVSDLTMNAWNDGSLQTAIIQVLQDDFINNNGNKIRQFLNSSTIGENVDISNPVAAGAAILEVLRFPIMATNDAILRLGGSPFNNEDPLRIYAGSDNDNELNSTVERIKGSDWEQSAQNVADFYETSGNLATPLVNMHTEFDHVSLYRNQTDYKAKVDAIWPDSPFFYPIKIDERYGHCNFTREEILTAINSLLSLQPQS